MTTPKRILALVGLWVLSHALMTSGTALGDPNEALAHLQLHLRRV